VEELVWGCGVKEEEETKRPENVTTFYQKKGRLAAKSYSMLAMMS
jgi:hypothetical protein